VGKGRAAAVSLLSELARSGGPAAARALHPPMAARRSGGAGYRGVEAPQAALQILHTAHAEPSSLRELFLRQLAPIRYRLSSSPKLLARHRASFPRPVRPAAMVAHAIMLRVRRVKRHWATCIARPEDYGRREGQIVPSTSKVSSPPKMVAVKNLWTDFGGRLPVPPRAPHVLCVGTANDRSVTPGSHLCLPPRVDPRLKRRGHGQMIY
jgi:hypothetical protein